MEDEVSCTMRLDLAGNDKTKFLPGIRWIPPPPDDLTNYCDNLKKLMIDRNEEGVMVHSYIQTRTKFPNWKCGLDKKANVFVADGFSWETDLSRNKAIDPIKDGIWKELRIITNIVFPKNWDKLGRRCVLYT